MKFFLKAGTILLMTMAVYAGNLVQNGDFSQGSQFWKQSEWQKEFIVVEDDVEPERGNVMQMRRTARFADWMDTNAAVQSITLPQPWHGGFRFSCDARVSDNAEGYPLAVVNLTFSDGSSSPSNAFRLNVGKSWEHKEFLIPREHAPVVAVSIHLTFRGVGTAAFDNFCLEEVDVPADLALTVPRALGNLFGDRGIAFTAEAHENVHFSIELTDKGGNVLDSRTGQGRVIQALFPEAGSDGVSCRVTLSELYGEATATQEFPVVYQGADVSAGAFRSYSVFTGDSMVKIMPGQIPCNNAEPLSISLAGNEHEACQIAIRRFPGTDIGKVAVEFSEFTDENGQLFPAEGLAFYQIGLVEAKKVIPHPCNAWSVSGWYPDALLPVSKVQIPDDNTFGIWIDVAAPAEMPAGIYHGRVTLVPEKAAATSVPMTIQVYPFSLPERPSMQTAFGIFWDDIKACYGPERFNSIKRKYMEYITDRRISPSDLYPAQFEDIDIMSDLAPRINTFNAAVNIGDDTADFVSWSEHVGKVLSSPFAKCAYFYGFDEFKDEMRGKVRNAFGQLKKLYPGIATFATSTAVDITVEAMRDLNIDHLCVMFDYYDKEKAAQVRANDPELQVWGYISFQPGYPYVNFMLEYPLVESRLFAWQIFNYDMDGFLYWNLNYYAQKGCEAMTRKPVNPEDGPYVAWSKRTGADGEIFSELNGDGKLLYYGENGPIGSIVLENIRDGLEDYDYLKLAEDQLAARKISEELSPSFIQYSRNPDDLRKAREQLAKMISAQ